MTLFETIKAINAAASLEPNINTLVLSGNITDLNTNNITVKYSAFCCEQQQHEHYDGYMNYRFRFFYVDRLTEDGKNKIEVQSTGIQVLQNILNRLKDSDILDVGTTYYFDVFDGRFEALCAGAAATVSIMVADEYCYEDIMDLLGDFNIDFNYDFWIKPISQN